MKKSQRLIKNSFENIIPKVSNDALIAMMVKEPRLLRRPLTQAGNRLIIGFDGPALEAVR